MTKENRIISFTHSGNVGDIIAGLTVLASFYHPDSIRKDTSTKSNLYLTLGPLMNEKMASILIPLMEKQPYINKCEVFNGTQHYDLNLDNFRKIAPLKYDFLSSVHLGKFHRFWNLAEPWIFNIEPVYVNDIILNRTKRYHGKLDYYTLCKKYKDRITFIGLKDEHEHFCNLFHVNIKWHETKDLLEAAKVIAGSKLYIGNQSVCWWITEAMKHPRLLEVCETVPNSMPVGKDGHCDWEDEYFKLIADYLK